MAEYINREAAIDATRKVSVGLINSTTGARDLGFTNALCLACNSIAAIPAADVRPVVRGKWKPRDLTWGRSYYYCSACEETVDMPTAMGIPMFRYCPNCGADMREKS